MRNMILICGLAAGCGIHGRTVIVSPSEPGISMNSRWVQGQPTKVLFEWPNNDSCDFDEWFCTMPAGLTTTVLGVTCHGCTIVGDPTRTTQDSQTPFFFEAVAITDEQISVEVRSRFDATHDERTVSASAQGDHEVALDIQCKTIDVAELRHDSTAGFVSGWIDSALLRPCGPTRLTNEAVVVFPRVRTFRDYLDFPFCFPGWACTNGWGEPLRPLEQLSILPAPVDWWRVANPSAYDPVVFAQLPADVSGSVEFHTQLLGGVDATASLEVPALVDQP